MAGALVIVALCAVDQLRLRLHRRVRGLQVRQRRGGPGAVPGAVRVPVPVLDGAAAAADRAGLVPHHRHLQPRELPARGHPQPVHRGLRRRGAGAARSVARWRIGRGLPGACRGQRSERGWCGHEVAQTWRWRVAWRNLHNFFLNPALVVPAVLFPMFFFTAFAGGLSSVSEHAGLRLPVRLHGVPVRVRAAAGVGVRRRVHGLLDRARLRVGLRAAADAGGAQPAARSSAATRSRRSAVRSFIWVILTAVALLVGMQVGGGAVRPGRPLHAGGDRELRRDHVVARASRCGSARSRRRR